jgi:hypothetical protein
MDGNCVATRVIEHERQPERRVKGVDGNWHAATFQMVVEGRRIVDPQR